MSMKNLIGFLFGKEDKNEIKDKKVNKNEKNNLEQSNSTNRLLKNLFTKTDGMSITSFPYKWEKEFFPPLSHEEKQYMIKEILRWYSTYLEHFLINIIEEIKEVTLKPSNNNIDVIKLNKDSPNTFEMLVESIAEQNIDKLILNRLNKLKDDELINWKPIEGRDCWTPNNQDMIPIISELAKLTINESKKTLEEQNKEKEKMIQMKKEITSSNKYAEFMANNLSEYLEKNKYDLIRHCSNRLLLEYNSFPYYYGKVEKKFKNNIYEKYHDGFGFDNYNELVSKVYIHLSRYIKTFGKTELIRWLDEQWEEFLNFMHQEYRHLNNQELTQLDPNNFNKYAFTLDFYSLMLFKIAMDGM